MLLFQLHQLILLLSTSISKHILPASLCELENSYLYLKLHFIYMTQNKYNQFILQFVNLYYYIITFVLLVGEVVVKQLSSYWERAHRAIFKVTHFLFPTTQLYELSNILTIRQLFIMHTALAEHKHAYSSSFLSSKRQK